MTIKKKPPPDQIWCFCEECPRHPEYTEIQQERHRQNAKWGLQNHADQKWLAIMVEEVGEVANAILEGKPIHTIRGELIQVAAVVVAWCESQRRRNP